MQLDIFENSREVMLRNDAAQALERRDAPAARAACERLAGECPLDPSLPALQLLVEVVEPGERGAFADHQSLHAAREAMLERIVPAALRTFGDGAAARWLAPLWRDLAQRAAPLPFKAEHALAHAAPLWLHAGNWNAAVQAVASIASWRRIPVPLSWMAEASLHLHGLQSSWPLLAELSWLSPAGLARVADRSPDPQLPRWLLRFEADFEDAGDEAGLAWLPAWLLTQQPSLAKPLAAAQASRHRPPEQAMRLLVELLGLERQGRHHDIVAKRKALRDLNPALYGGRTSRRGDGGPGQCLRRMMAPSSTDISTPASMCRPAWARTGLGRTTPLLFPIGPGHRRLAGRTNCRRHGTRTAAGPGFEHSACVRWIATLLRGSMTGRRLARRAMELVRLRRSARNPKKFRR